MEIVTDTVVSPPQTQEPRAPMWAGAITGLVAMLCGLALAELITVLFGWESPLVEVGNRVVDLVPKSMRDWAISTFGTNDKLVLRGGVAIALIAIAALAGIWMVRGHARRAVVLICVVLLAGALAPLGRGGSGIGSTFAVVAGGALAIYMLTKLGSLATAMVPAQPPAGEAQPSAAEMQRIVQPIDGESRRRFLIFAGAATAGAAVAGGLATWIRSKAEVAAERLGVTLPNPVETLPPVPAEVDVGIDGVSSFITPNETFYRIDTALVPPRVTTEGWEMAVSGMVDNPITLTYEELLDRPMIEADITIACVSNELGGDLIGTARWLGCRLDDLLAEAGVDPSADQIVGRSVDGFTAGFPTTTLDDGRDAIVAVGMNGEPLPVDHGYPARLIVPGIYGYVSATKWLEEIELTTFADFQGYWLPRGWDREAPVVTMSRIDTPKSGQSVTAGEPIGVGGVAWAMNRGIERVEVQVDDGDWRQAELGDEYTETTWRQWGFTFEPSGGDHTITARATDTDGYTQTSEVVRSGPNAATGYPSIRISAS